MFAHLSIRARIARPRLEPRRNRARFGASERGVAELRAEREVGVVGEAARDLYDSQTLHRHVVPAADARGCARVVQRAVAVAAEGPLRRPGVEAVVGVDGVEIELARDLVDESQ